MEKNDQHISSYFTSCHIPDKEMEIPHEVSENSGANTGMHNIPPLKFLLVGNTPSHMLVHEQYNHTHSCLNEWSVIFT